VARAAPVDTYAAYGGCGPSRPITSASDTPRGVRRSPSLSVCRRSSTYRMSGSRPAVALSGPSFAEIIRPRRPGPPYSRSIRARSGKPGLMRTVLAGSYPPGLAAPADCGRRVGARASRKTTA
jgi:hypothetical protein